MRKLSKLFLMGAIALGLAACNNEDVPNPPQEEGNTHAAVTLRMPKNSFLKAGADNSNDYNHIGTWAGQDLIENISIYLVDGTAIIRHAFTVGGPGSGKDYEASSSGNDVVLTPKTTATALRTTEGTKTVYVVVNETAEVQAHLGVPTSPTQFHNAYNNIALVLANSHSTIVTDPETSAGKLAVKNGTDNETIVMTNVADATIDVEPNVTVAETLAAAGAKNRASVNVQRAVARVMVTIAEGTGGVYTVGQIGTLTDVRWVLAQGENSLFVQQKADYATPNFAWVPGVTAPAYWDTDITGTNAKYDYSGLYENYDANTLFGGTTVATMSDYSNNTIGKVTDELDNSLSGKFLLPTTHNVADGEASNYKKGNTAYVLVRAKFIPHAAAFADGGTYTSGDDFYVGANGQFYKSAANAVNPAEGGVTGQTVARYIGGKVLYYAWVNPDNVDTGEWYNSPVLRNHVYHIHISGFRNLGTNWNPLFPEDPDNPKGELENPNEPEGPDNPRKPLNPDPKPQPENLGDPEEPTNPIDPTDPLTTPETWMSVDVTVLPWQVHSYEVELGI